MGFTAIRCGHICTLGSFQGSLCKLMDERCTGAILQQYHVLNICGSIHGKTANASSPYSWAFQMHNCASVHGTGLCSCIIAVFPPFPFSLFGQHTTRVSQVAQATGVWHPNQETGYFSTLPLLLYPRPSSSRTWTTLEKSLTREGSWM